MTYTPPPPIDLTKGHRGYTETETICYCERCRGVFRHSNFYKCAALEREGNQWLCIHCRGKIVIKGVKI